MRRGACALTAWVLLCIPLPAAAQHPPPVFSTNEQGTARAPGGTAGARKDAVQALLDGTGAVGDVPLAAAVFAMAPPDSGLCRVLVAVEVGRRQILPDSLAIGLRIFDEKGSVAFNGGEETNVAPALPDSASPLQYVAASALAPGRYRIRVVVIDSGGRQAALDHPFAVDARHPGDALSAGSAMIGLGDPAGGALRPLVRAELARAGAVAWVDVGSGATSAGRVGVTDETGAVLATAPLTIDRPGPTGVRLAHGELPVRMLPPGEYVATLTIEDGARGRIVRSRPFTLGALPPPDASALGEVVTASVGAFSTADVLDPAVLGPVLRRALEADPSGADDAMRAAVSTVESKGLKAVNVKAIAKRTDLSAWMLRGAVLLDQGRLEDAAGGFRAALRASSEFFPAIVYLGACYAAGGRDREAVGAWQTALVTESSSPLVFRLAADGLLRLGDSAEAVTLLAEAAERWPGETALVRRHTLALAAREGPAHALDALLPAVEKADTADTELVALAARLAIASAARGDDQAASRVARVAALATRHGEVPPLLARWKAFLEK